MPHPLSSLRSSPSTCAVCLCPISITSAGLVCLHGPFNSDCPGSQQPPLSDACRSSHAHAVIWAPSPGFLCHSIMPPSPSPLRNNCRIFKRIPKNSRDRAGRKLASIIDTVVAHNDHASWHRLLLFGSRCLRVPSNRGRRQSLTKALNKKINEEADRLGSVRLATPASFSTQIRALLLAFQQTGRRRLQRCS